MGARPHGSLRHLIIRPGLSRRGRDPLRLSRSPPPLCRHNHRDADRPARHEVGADEPQRKKADVVELALGIEHEPEGRDSAEGGHDQAEPALQNHGEQEGDAGDGQDPRVRLGGQQPQEGGDVGVAHGRGVGLAQAERNQPPPRQQESDGQG